MEKTTLYKFDKDIISEIVKELTGLNIEFISISDGRVSLTTSDNELGVKVAKAIQERLDIGAISSITMNDNKTIIRQQNIVKAEDCKRII